MRRAGPTNRSIASRLLLFTAGLSVLLVGVSITVVVLNGRGDVAAATRERVTAIAVSVAASPELPELLTADVSAQQASVRLQPFASEVMQRTGADFVVIMRPDGTRLTHPNPANIGLRYLGTREPALAGQTYLEVYTGTLGPSTRAITPVRNGAGKIVGLVSVGVTEAHISAATWRSMAFLVGLAIGALALGVLGALLIARWVRRLTLGMGPTELARMYLYYDAVLHSTHEGMVLLDTAGRVVMINPQAQQMLELDSSPVGQTGAQAGMPGAVAQLIDGPQEVTDQVVVTKDRVLVVNRRGVDRDGIPAGTVATLRDHTELQSLHGELDRIRGFSQALRSQAHESANRLHTVVSLIELGEVEQALDFAVEDLRFVQHLTDQVMAGVGDRAVAALLLGKSAQGAQQGIELTVVEGFDLPEGVCPPRDLVTIIGNLIDNAFDAAAAAPPPRQVRVAARVTPQGVRITVTDSGAGMCERSAAEVFADDFSTKPVNGIAGPRGLGLALVRQTVTRWSGTVTAEPGDGGRFVVLLPLGAGALESASGSGTGSA